MSRKTPKGEDPPMVHTLEGEDSIGRVHFNAGQSGWLTVSPSDLMVYSKAGFKECLFVSSTVEAFGYLLSDVASGSSAAEEQHLGCGVLVGLASCRLNKVDTCATILCFKRVKSSLVGSVVSTHSCVVFNVLVNW